MSGTVDILLSIRSDVSQIAAAQKRVDDLKVHIGDLWQTMLAGAQLNLGAMAVGAVAEVPGQIKAAVTAGIEYNATLEQRRMAYTSLLGSAGAAAHAEHLDVDDDAAQIDPAAHVCHRAWHRGAGRQRT